MWFFGTLAKAGRILALTWKPAAEPGISFQVTNLALVGHCVFQNTDDAHCYGWKWLILGLVQRAHKILSGERRKVCLHLFIRRVVVRQKQRR